MKIICNQKLLAHKIGIVQKAINSKTNFDLLKGILIVAKKDQIVLGRKSVYYNANYNKFEIWDEEIWAQVTDCSKEYWKKGYKIGIFPSEITEERFLFCL